MSATFTFLSESHTYIENGETVLSVTQLLDRVGLVCYEGVDPEVLRRKAEIGTAAHAAAHYYDDGDLNWDSVDPVVTPYVSAWAKFRQETGFAPRLIERRGIAEMSGARYGYTLDREGLFNGRPTVVELKCTAAIEPSWQPQVAAYEHALFCLDRIRRQRVAVHLKPNGNYSLVSLSDVRDYSIFRTALLRPEGWERIITEWLSFKGRNKPNGNSNYCDD